MTVIEAKQGTRNYILGFQRGEDVTEELRKFLKEKNIDAGLITSGIGSLESCTIHYITTTGLPPSDEFVSLQGPLEIASLQGSVAGGEPHMHISLYNQKTDTFHIGHLEPGAICCYRVELGIIAFNEVKTERVLDEKTGLIDIVGVN